MLVTSSRKSLNKYSYVLVVILLLFSVGCTKDEAKTSSNEQENTMIKNSKIKDYRVENKEYFDELKTTTYNSTIYADNTEKKTYTFKDIDLDKLDDDQYYKILQGMFNLARQGANDKAVRNGLLKNDKKELDEKILQLEELNKKYSIEVKE